MNENISEFERTKRRMRRDPDGEAARLEREARVELRDGNRLAAEIREVAARILRREDPRPL